ncbi:MAG: CARDB domain-containing protein [Candidatus Latescibacterota bacterium]
MVSSPLSGFDGQNARGTWTLTIADEASGDAGTLESWSLLIEERDDCGDQATAFSVGERVRVRADVTSPRYGWGSVSAGEVGTVTRIDDCLNMIVDFPSQSGWMAYIPEMELAPALPDLIGAVVSAPTSGTPGASISVGVRVTNQGTASNTRSHTVRIYLSRDATITSADSLLLSYSETAQLAPRTSVTATKTVGIPARTTAGTCYLGVVVDATNTVPESNEDNNTSSGRRITIVNPYDVNGDGVVSVADAIAVLRVVVGAAAYTSLADVNQDGRVDAADALLVLENLPASKVAVSQAPVWPASRESVSLRADEAVVVHAGESTAGTLFAQPAGGGLVGRLALHCSAALLPHLQVVAGAPGVWVWIGEATGSEEVAQEVTVAYLGDAAAEVPLLRLQVRDLPESARFTVRIEALWLADGDGNAVALADAGADLRMELSAAPSGNALGAAYPNPCNPLATIPFEVAAPAPVSVCVLNAAGQLVRTLVEETRRPGRYEAVWDGLDQTGHASASGVYLIELRIGPYRRIGRLVLVR